MIHNLWLLFVGLSCGIVVVEVLNRGIYKKQQIIINLQRGIIEKYEEIMLRILEGNKNDNPVT